MAREDNKQTYWFHYKSAGISFVERTAVVQIVLY